jgi:hypothetical protein
MLAGIANGFLNYLCSVNDREVVFIDSSLPNINSLKAEWADKEIVVLSEGADPWVTMSNTLIERGGVSAVHLVSHGQSGELWIAGARYGSDNIPYELLKSWKNGLKRGADIHVYGCNVGEGELGDEFLRNLAISTGADVAVSNNTTGFSGLGGDWSLEKTYGNLESGSLIARGWTAILPTPAFAVNGDPLVFNTFTQLSGTTGVGAKRLYSNVITISGQSIDAIIEITEISSGTSVSSFDSTSSPYSNADYFQPNLTVGSSGGYAVFRISFILGGSGNPGTDVQLNDVLVNSYDIDGTQNGGPQYTDFTNIASYTLSSTSEIRYSVSSGVARFLTTNTSNVTAAPGTVAGDNVRVRVALASVTQMDVKVGANTAGGLAYYGLDFSQGPLFTNSPIAVNDLNTTTINIPVSGDVLINDYLWNGTTQTQLTSSNATTSKIADPSHGTVVVNADGTYSYTPTTGYTGQDSFIYQVCLVASPSVCDTATVTITITSAPAVNPAVTKSFNPATVAANGISTLTITLANTNATSATLTRAMTDTLPANVVVANTPNVGGTCTGTITAVAGASTVSYASGASIPSGGCTITVDVKSSTNGSYTNTIATGALQTDLGNNPTSATANLLVSASPTVSKSFSPALIATNGTSTLTIFLGNGNGSSATLSSALVDTLPTNLVVASTPNIGGTCAGTKTAVAGGSTVTYASGASIPSGGCTITVDVTSSTNGTYTNTIASGALATSLGTYNIAASSSLAVSSPPTVSKSFSPTTIATGGTSTLTITLGNSNSTPATLSSSLIDRLPANLFIASSPNIGGTCTGSKSAAAGGNTVTYASGSTIPNGSSCTITVDVTSSTSGSYTNTIAIGDLQTNLGSNVSAASDTLTVGGTPTVLKSFSPATIAPGGTSTLTITLGNSNAGIATLSSALVDTLPSNVTLSNVTFGGSCTGTKSGTSGGSTVTYASGGTIPANSSCTITATVTSSTTGSYTNTIGAGDLQTDLGNNASAASATLTVLGSPTIAKAFGTSPIAPGGTSTITFTLTNPNATQLTGASFTDTLANMSVSGAQNAGGTCTGASSNSLSAGATSLSLSGLTLPVSASCTVTVLVTSTTPGVHPNTASGVTTTETPTAGTGSNTANLTVQTATGVTLSKNGPATALVSGSVDYTLTLANTGTAPTGTTLHVLDQLPAGVTATAVMGLTNIAAGGVSCTNLNVAGGLLDCTVTLTTPMAAGTGTTGASFKVTVTMPSTVPSPALLTNYASANPDGTSTTPGSPGSSCAPNATTVCASAPTTVQAPTVAKTFGAASITSGGSTTLVFTLTNSSGNPAQSGIALGDPCPPIYCSIAPPLRSATAAAAVVRRRRPTRVGPGCYRVLPVLR